MKRWIWFVFALWLLFNVTVTPTILVLSGSALPGLVGWAVPALVVGSNAALLGGVALHWRRKRDRRRQVPR